MMNVLTDALENAEWSDYNDNFLLPADFVA